MARRFQTLWRLAALLPALATGLFCAQIASAASPLDAVGRITYGAVLQPGRAICSGTLVAPDLVLTAGHCVRGVLNKPTTVHFSAAWTKGKPMVERIGRKIFLAQPDKPQRTLAGDAALLQLDRPVSPAEARPLPLADPTARRFAMVGFDRSAPGIERVDLECHLRRAEFGVIGLSCPVVSGNSGAPVLQWDGTAWSVAAIMVAASGSGPVRAWAALVPDVLKQQISSPSR